MKTAVWCVVVLAALFVSVRAQSAQPAPYSEVEKLTKQLNEALDQLAITRAARGDCESTLAPLEAQGRRADSQQRWADQKAAMEKARPGYTCDPHTLVCEKKPDPK